MSEPIQPHVDETEVVDSLRVACDGPVFSKHPRVYLTMMDDENGKPCEVVCPYCGKVFKYSGD